MVTYIWDGWLIEVLQSMKVVESFVDYNLGSKLLLKTLPYFSCAWWRLPLSGRQKSPGVAHTCSVVSIHLIMGKLYFRQPSVVVLRLLGWILWCEKLSSGNQKGMPLLWVYIPYLPWCGGQFPSFPSVTFMLAQWWRSLCSLSPRCLAFLSLR